MKRTWKQTLSAVLSIAMMFSMTGMNTVLAAENGLAIGASSLCEHHESHTDDCYTDELICEIVQDSGEPLATDKSAGHEHTQDCYKLDCQFICDICGSQKNAGHDGSALTQTTTATEKSAAEQPIITVQPVGATYTQGDAATALSVTASVSDGGTLSYQWYYNPIDQTYSGMVIGGAVSSSYTPTTNERDIGTIYYYCVVTNTLEMGEPSATSNAVAVVVTATPASSITTAAELKTALESTALATISVTGDILGLGGNIAVGANHTLHIADGVTISTAGTDDHQLYIPRGKTLTLAGSGTLEVNNRTKDSFGIWVEGTLKLTIGSKLLVANKTPGCSGIGLGIGSKSGSLVSEGGEITISNDGQGSFGIIAGSNTKDDTVRLIGGKLMIQNKAGYGISSVKLTVTDNCAMTLANSGDSGTYGIMAIAASIMGSTLHIANTAGTGLRVDTLTVGSGTVTVNNSGDSTGLTLVDTDSRFTGANGGKLTLMERATLKSVGNVFNDRGTVCTNDSTITVAAASVSPSSTALTEGGYVWNGTHFAKRVFYTVRVTDGTASPSTAAEDATVTLIANAAPSGQRFKEWTITPAVTFVEGTTKTSTTAKFTMPAKVVTAEATYENIPADTYAITVTGGTTNPTTAAKDATVTLTANAAPSGQRFKEWTISPAVTFTDGTSATSATAKFTMPAQAVTAEATYENIPADTYAVTVTDGTASPTPAAKDATVTLTANAAPSGQRFKEWTITPAVTFVEGTTKTSATAKFTMPGQAVTAEATYENIPAGTTVTTAAELKAALESTTPATINVTADIVGLEGASGSDGISVGADHTLHIADGVTISTAGKYDNQLYIPEGKTLTLAGSGTLKSNNVSNGYAGISVTGTLKLTTGSKLLAANSIDYTFGIGIGGGSISGSLVSEGGEITLSNSGTSSAGITAGSNTGNDAVTLIGGKLTIQNAAGYGMNSINLTVTDRCAMTLENSGDYNSYGIMAIAASITDSTLHIANTAGMGLQAEALTITDSSVIVANAVTRSTGIEIHSYNMGTFDLKNSSLHLSNTIGTGLKIGTGDKLTIDGSTVSIAASSGTGLTLDGTLAGGGSGKLLLAVGARLNSVANIFVDRGSTYQYSGTVTAQAESGPASVEILTAGEYVWNGTHFAKGGGATADAATPVITTQPQAATVQVGQSVTLRVAASVSDGGTLSYQWYGNSNSELGGIIPGATGATYTPSTAAVGTMYYRCIVTNTNNNASGNKTAMIYSNQIAVTVQSGGGNSGGSSGGGGGGGGTVIDPPTVVKPDPAKPDTPTTTTTNVKADSKGNAAITDSVLDAAVKKAQDEAKKNGTEKNGIVVEFNITGTAAGSNMNVNLPKSVLDKLEKAGVKSATIKQNGMELTLDLAAIKEIQKANVDAILSVSKQDVKKLSKEAQAAIGSRPVYNISMKTKEVKAITGFGKGQLSVAIPYTSAAGEKQGNLFCVYVDDKGKVEWLTNSSYDAVNKKMIFATNHLSVYGVGYKADTASTRFTDIGNHWAKDDIQFVVNRGLLSGTSKTTFSPNAAMTRGMFVTALGRLANADVSDYKQSSFTDVKNDTYYMGYIEWANKNNIVTGIGDGEFAPDQSITREQMAVIMQNYAKAIGFTLPKVHGENTFADSVKISAYANAAVKQMQMAGVISGKSGNIFDPQGTATRAEVSAVLRRLVELAISSDTM